MDICTFQFATKKSFDKVAWALLETPFTFSVVYGEAHYGKPRCITVWGRKAIDEVRNACKEAGISYLEV
jgi:predicted fused transcriptional regulator/phosphomethylpyrimidine kinase